MKPERLPRHRTGDSDLDRRLVELLDAAGVERNRDQLFEILSSVVHLAQDGADRLNLKITNAALKEMRSAFKVFAPYQNTPKVRVSSTRSASTSACPSSKVPTPSSRLTPTWSR